MIRRELKFDRTRLKYRGVVGTGGIGSGKFFVLNGDHTLGREESRSGHFLNRNDYCKQHIVLHYLKILLGPSFEVIPVGKVGDDVTGQILFNEMQETGFVMKLIQKVAGVSTLFSFCFYYPDGSGGNLTTDNSASSMVDPSFIELATSCMKKLGPKGIIVAVPEVPLPARRRLIELGKQAGMFCAASFTTGEISEILNNDLLAYTDLLALNYDEAKAAAGIDIEKKSSMIVINHAVQNLSKYNKKIMVTITAGRDGSWCWDGTRLRCLPAARTNAVSTAGAGDAFFSGILTGLALGIHLFEAQQLATLIAGLSVCSPDTIHKGIDRQTLNKFSDNADIKLSRTILKLLED